VRTRTRRAALALLGLGVLDAAGYSVIVPVTPAIAAATGAGPALIGALVASFPAAMLVGYALAGSGIRRRRPTVVLAGALALLALGSLGFVLGAGLPAWFAARLVMGLGSGALWIAISFATLEHWPGREYQGMSRIYAAYSVGGLVGPALGAIGGVRGPFLAYLALVALALPLVVAVGTPPRRRRFETDRSAAPAGLLAGVRGRPVRRPGARPDRGRVPPAAGRLVLAGADRLAVRGDGAAAGGQRRGGRPGRAQWCCGRRSGSWATWPVR